LNLGNNISARVIIKATIIILVPGTGKQARRKKEQCGVVKEFGKDFYKMQLGRGGKPCLSLFLSLFIFSLSVF